MVRVPTVRRFLRYLRPYVPHLILAMLCLVGYALFSSLMLYLVKPLFGHLFERGAAAAATEAPAADGFMQAWRVWLDDLIETLIGSPTIMGTLEKLCLLIVATTVLKALFYYLQGRLLSRLQQGVVKQLRDALYGQLHRLSLSFFHRNRTGHLVSRVTSDVWVVEEVLDQTPTQVVRDPLLILFYLYVLLAISWQLTLVAMVVVPMTIFLVTRMGKRLRHYSTRSQEQMAEVNDILEETINGIRVVKAFGMSGFEIRKFRAATKAYFTLMIKMIQVKLLATPAGEVLGSIMGALVIWVGGRLVYVNQTLTPSEFITFLVLMFALARPIKSLSIVHIKAQRALAAGDRIFEVLDTEPDVQDRVGARVLEGHAGSIVFDRVWFRYDRGPDVLKEINLEVQRGDVLAVVGPSGAGKSTLLDLIPRFYDPTEGRIRIDGSDLRDLTIDSLRARMGIVTQDVILFNDSVYRNIGYGSDRVDPEAIERAARMANAHEFIEALPEGYATRVGQRGVRLSGGQRQRLAIARALLKDPDILIFDEATSSLDTEAELLVQEAIDRLMKNRTVFVVAHRLSTIQHADRIVVIEAGALAEEGAHAELYAKDGLYRYLYDLQFKQRQGLRSEAKLP